MKTGKRKDLGPDGLYGFLKSILPKSKFTIAQLAFLANDRLRDDDLPQISTQAAYKVVVKMLNAGLISVLGPNSDKRNRLFIAKTTEEVPVGRSGVDKMPPTSANVAKLMAEVGDEIEAETAVAKTAVIGRKIAERIADLNRMRDELAQLLAGDVYTETRQKFERLNEEINALAKSAGEIICLDCKKKREQMITDRVMLLNASDRIKARDARLAADALQGGPASVIHSK